MAGQTTAGTKLSVSLSAPGTLDLSGYTTLYPSMNDVGEITDMGEYGRVYAIVSTIPLAERRTQKYKGSYDEGSMTLVFNIDEADSGQDDLRTNLDVDADAYFAVTHQDGTVDFFSGLVTSASKAVGAADQMYTSNATIEINSDIIESPAI
jgi:hypothetical protein